MVFWCKQWTNRQINKCWTKHASPLIILTYCKNNGVTKWKCVMFYLSYGHSNIEGNRLTQIRLAVKEASRTTIRKSICKHLHESSCLRKNRRTLLKKNTCHTYLFSICNSGPDWPRTTLLFELRTWPSTEVILAIITQRHQVNVLQGPKFKILSAFWQDLSCKTVTGNDMYLWTSMVSRQPMLTLSFP